MSAFLKPVHYWLYTKIKYQESLNQLIIKHTDFKNESLIDQECGIFLAGCLEEIIDHQAIHQWLFNQLCIVEKRFALIIKHLKKEDLKVVEKVIFQAGKEVGKQEEFQNCRELFWIIDKYLLNGMPCDQGIKIIMQDNDQIIYEYNQMLDRYLELETVQLFQNTWLKGLLEASSIIQIRLDAHTYMLKMEV